MNILKKLFLRNLKTACLIFGVFSVPNLFAHPNGSSKITVTLKTPDSLLLNVNANMGDLINIAGVAGYGEEFEGAESMRDKIQSYLFSRFPITFDGQAANNMSVIQWKENGNGPLDILDSSNMMDSVVDITIYFPIPEKAEQFSLTAQAFAEYGILALANTSVMWQGKELYQEILGLDKTLWAPVKESVLKKRLMEKEKAEELLRNPPPKPFSQFFSDSFKASFTSLYWVLVFGVLAVVYGGGLKLGAIYLLLHGIALYLSFLLSVKEIFTFNFNLGQAFYSLAILYFSLSLLFKWPGRFLGFPVVSFSAFLFGSGISPSLVVFGMNPQDFQNYALASSSGVLTAQLLLALPIAAGILAAAKSKKYLKVYSVVGGIGAVLGIFGLLLSFV